jgi:tetratricopeptide (TPR) repeat protein
MRALLIILGISFCSFFFAQKNSNPDSLQALWSNSKVADTVRLKAFKNLIWDHVIFVNPDSAFKMAQSGINLAKEKGLKKFEADLYNMQGVSHSMRGNTDKAVDLYLKSALLKEEIGDKRGLGSTFGNIGILYQNQGDHAKAIEYFTKSLKLAEECDNKSGKAVNLVNIATIFTEQKEYEKAIDYLDQSLKLHEEINDPGGVSTVLINLGGIYQYKGDVKKAIETFSRALELKEKLNDQAGIAVVLSNLGSLYYFYGDPKRGLAYLERSLKIDEEIGNKLGIAKNYINQASIFQKELKTGKAIETSEKAYRLAREVGSLIHMRDAALLLFSSYDKLGKYKLALTSYTVYTKLKDSIVNDEERKAVMKQEMQYAFEKQKALDEKEHEGEIKLSEERERRQKVISYSVTIGLLFVAIFAFFVFNRLRLTRKQKQIIEEQKHLVDEKQKEIIDSIRYAKRIQQSLLTNEKYIGKNLDRLGNKRI